MGLTDLLVLDDGVNAVSGILAVTFVEEQRVFVKAYQGVTVVECE